MAAEPLHRADRFRVVIHEPRRPRVIGCSAVTSLALHRDDPPARVRLTRGVGKDRSLFAWRRSQHRGKDVPRDVTIDLLDAAGEPTMRWTLEAARPQRWEGPELDAATPGVALEHLELDHEDITWDANPDR